MSQVRRNFARSRISTWTCWSLHLCYRCTICGYPKKDPIVLSWCVCSIDNSFRFQLYTVNRVVHAKHYQYVLCPPLLMRFQQHGTKTRCTLYFAYQEKFVFGRQFAHTFKLSFILRASDWSMYEHLCSCSSHSFCTECLGQMAQMQAVEIADPKNHLLYTYCPTCRKPQVRAMFVNVSKSSFFTHWKNDCERSKSFAMKTWSFVWSELTDASNLRVDRRDCTLVRTIIVFGTTDSVQCSIAHLLKWPLYAMCQHYGNFMPWLRYVCSYLFYLIGWIWKEQSLPKTLSRGWMDSMQHQVALPLELSAKRLGGWRRGNLGSGKIK